MLISWLSLQLGYVSEQFAFCLVTHFALGNLWEQSLSANTSRAPIIKTDSWWATRRIHIEQINDIPLKWIPMYFYPWPLRQLLFVGWKQFIPHWAQLQIHLCAFQSLCCFSITSGKIHCGSKAINNFSLSLFLLIEEKCPSGALYHLRVRFKNAMRRGALTGSSVISPRESLELN